MIATDEPRRALIGPPPRLSRFTPLPRIPAFDLGEGVGDWCGLFANQRPGTVWNRQSLERVNLG
ncbi:MAG: hypothetical protein M3Q65_14750 [Chloroflexota bacterium]|nr:hypothetical protein [Chloroflexota bacterium]